MLVAISGAINSALGGETDDAANEAKAANEANAAVANVVSQQRLQQVPCMAPMKIACGLYHSASVSNCNIEYWEGTGDEKKLEKEFEAQTYVWGSNKWNMLGVGKDKTETHPKGAPELHTPTQMSRKDYFNTGTWTYEVSCGSNHTLWLAMSAPRTGVRSTIYASGLGNRGRLGSFMDNGTEPAFGEESDIWTVEGKPRIVNFPEQIIALRICCGSDHSLCIASLDKSSNLVLYAWGMNDEGQCGVGHAQDVVQPTLVKLKNKVFPVSHCSAGARHTLAVTAHPVQDTVVGGIEQTGGTQGGMVFAWGCGSQGRLGLGTYNKVLSPKHVKENLYGNACRAVACGETHSGAVTVNNEVFMWGAGSHGRTGLGGDEETPIDIPVPRELEMLTGQYINQLSLGAYHSLCLTGRAKGAEKQKLYAWGVGEATGVLPPGDRSIVSVPRLLSLNFPTYAVAPVIVQIAAGTYHSLLMLESGEIAVFGVQAAGRLGTGHAFKEAAAVLIKGFPGFCTHDPPRKNRVLRHPIERDVGLDEQKDKVEDPYGLAAIGCGTAHTAVMTNNGQIYTWGSGSDGQLGLGTGADGEQQDVPLPKLIPKLMPPDRKVIKLSVGDEHCMAVTSKGDLFAWGSGKNGQCGTGKTKNSCAPEQVRLDLHGSQVQCIDVAAGESHTVAMCRGQEGYALYTWGDQSSGKLGIGTEASHNAQPRWVKMVECKGTFGTPKVACGQDHTMYISDGRCWTWGAGYFGRLGHGDDQNQYEPKMVESGLINVRDISCGSYHTCALAGESEKEKRLFVWGKGNMVCHPHENVVSPMLFDQFDNNPFCISVTCGSNHTMCCTVTDTGSERTVYVWGDNRSGQLGLGSNARRGDVNAPESLKGLPDHIKVMGAGTHHTVAYLENNQTFAWGVQSCGRLGLEDHIAERIVDAPKKVKQSWSSVEAMSGFDTVDTVNIVEDEDAEEDKKPKAGTAPSEQGSSTGKGMLSAIGGGQSVQQFATMQRLLKQETENSQEESLVKSEKELMIEFRKFDKEILTLPGREQDILRLQGDLKNSFLQNLRHFKRQTKPDLTRSDETSLTNSLLLYEDLIWILQQQVFYLATLSTSVEGNKEGTDTFMKIVNCIYADPSDERTVHLFITMLKLIIRKEIETSKTLFNVFQGDSRLFQLFSTFALKPMFHEDIVHPWMRGDKVSSVGFEGDNKNDFLRRVIDVTYQGVTFALSKNEFRHAEKEQRGRDLKGPDLAAEFNNSLEKFKDFMLTEFLACLKTIRLHDHIKTIFAYTLEEVKNRKFSAEETALNISADLAAYEPLLNLLIRGMIIPMLKNPGYYAGKSCGLGQNSKEATDLAVAHNLRVFAKFLEGMLNGSFEETDGGGGEDRKTMKPVAGLAKNVKPELLKWLQIPVRSARDNINTCLTIDVYIAHFRRSRPIVSVPTSVLLKLSNLLLENRGKLKINSNDPMVEICERIGKHSGESIEKFSEPEDDTIHNFYLNVRFLLEPDWGRTMVICPTSHCPVPPKLSSSWDGNAVAGSAAPIRVYQSDNQYPLLEQLFRKSDQLKAKTFQELRSEVEEFINDQSKKQEGNDFALVHLLHSCISRLEELIASNRPIADTLRVMTTTLVTRDAHRRYLEQVHLGLSRIEQAQKEYAEDLYAGKAQLQSARKASMKLELPILLVDAAAAAGIQTEFEKKNMILMKISDFSRDPNLTGVSFAPMKTYPLKQLYKQKVVLEKQGILEKITIANVQLTMTIIQGGVDITVASKNGRQVNTLRRIRITEEKMDELRRTQKGNTVLLPFDDAEPLLTCGAAELAGLLTSLSTGESRFL